MTTDSTPKENPFARILKKIKVVKAQYARELPPCPLCGAPALAGTEYDLATKISHDCNCVVEQPLRYDAELLKVWSRRQAEPYFLAHLPSRYHDYTRANWISTESSDRVRILFDGPLTNNAYLYGPAGTGKTYAAVALARNAAQQGQTAQFWGMADLIGALRDVYALRTPPPELRHWDVLVLDDIDKIRPTPFVFESLYALIEARWSEKKCTIFTAQNNPDAAARTLTPEGDEDMRERAADALASRMSAGYRFQIKGGDRRAG